jgi:drug/metabolite transporter (DMT)-like permease
MLRGSILIFVGIMSVIFLKRRLEWFRWLGMLIIMSGLIVVGVSDFLQVIFWSF